MKEQLLSTQARLQTAERSFILSGILVAICGLAIGVPLGICKARGVIFAMLFAICNIRSWKLFVQGLVGSSLARTAAEVGEDEQAVTLRKASKLDMIGCVLTKIAALTIIVVFFIYAQEGEVASFVLGFLMFLTLGICFLYPSLNKT